MNEKRFYSFSNLEFHEMVAHDGKGAIKTVQVEGQNRKGAFNFIDLTEIPPGNSIGCHTHELDNEEVYVIISGEGRMYSEGVFFMVGAGDVIVNSPGGTHALENVGSDILRLVVLEANIISTHEHLI
ncbi:hypothetical protein MNBD_GAMMA16-1934 [hydrothermal vent metagenome]|uniref:Cupin type-2 domain-containing protein n=1 Tax=hydrothermal vent metagenome TaxID=652676 RepID=A0A3B0Z5V4_9ZZZZ